MIFPINSKLNIIDILYLFKFNNEYILYNDDLKNQNANIRNIRANIESINELLLHSVQSDGATPLLALHISSQVAQVSESLLTLMQVN